jgi:hypothetical protein
MRSMLPLLGILFGTLNRWPNIALEPRASAPSTFDKATRSFRCLLPRPALRPAALLRVATRRRRLGAARGPSGVRCQNATDFRSASGTFKFAHSCQLSPTPLCLSRPPSEANVRRLCGGEAVTSKPASRGQSTSQPEVQNSYQIS